MSKFKPCPFCASTDIERGFYDEVNDNYLFCKNCRFGAGDFYAKDDIEGKWNTRPLEDALSDEIKRLRAQNDQLRAWLDEARSVIEAYQTPNVDNIEVKP